MKKLIRNMSLILITFIIGIATSYSQLTATRITGQDENLRILISESNTLHYSGTDTSVLPVWLISFTYSVSRNYVTLNWTTSEEIDNAGFEIERKNKFSDEWTRTGYVKGSGTSNVPLNYSFTERVNTGTYSYRLKQIDLNGNFEYHYLKGEIYVGLKKIFKVSQNYPNPFNPVTRIDFEMHEDAYVNLRIFDISGREVMRLLDEKLYTEGYYTFEFNAAGLTSGVYYYEIRIGDEFRDVKSMTLIR